MADTEVTSVVKIVVKFAVTVVASDRVIVRSFVVSIGNVVNLVCVGSLVGNTEGESVGGTVHFGFFFCPYSVSILP